MDYAMLIVWGAVMVVTIIAEVATTQMISIWFSCASLVSLVLACFNAPRWAQFCVFVAMTALLLILTRPIVKKLKKQYVRTNADMNIGKTAIVTETIHNELSQGRATIGGVSWKAVSADGNVIEKDETVTIQDIEGAKLIVSR
jgi:membrane protein implicated in regulation of membrane protease activity